MGECRELGTVSREDRAMKLAVIGAGSTYTPELISGLMRARDRLDVGELVLHDIDRERRDVVGGLARRILERQGYAGAVRLTGDLDRALDGAGAVLVQIRVGGQAARLRDETIPAACGCVGQETTGAGGLAKRGAQCRSCSRSRLGPASSPRPMHGSSTSPTRLESSRERCSTRDTAQWASATWRSPCSVRSLACWAQVQSV